MGLKTQWKQLRIDYLSFHSGEICLGFIDLYIGGKWAFDQVIACSLLTTVSKDFDASEEGLNEAKKWVERETANWFNGLDYES